MDLKSLPRAAEIHNKLNELEHVLERIKDLRVERILISPDASYADQLAFEAFKKSTRDAVRREMDKLTDEAKRL